MKKTLDGFQKMFYTEERSCNSKQNQEDVFISQLDGANDSESSQEEELVEKNILLDFFLF